MKSFILRSIRLRLPSASLLALILALAPNLPLRAEVKVTGIDLYAYKIPRKHAFVTSKGTSDFCTGIALQLNAEDAKSGKKFTATGEILPRGLVTNETMADAWAGAKVFRELLVGRTLPGKDLAADHDLIVAWLDELRAVAAKQKLTTSKPPLPGRELRATQCGFDMTLLDLVGQIHGVPMFEVLGGAKRDSITISAPTISANAGDAEIADSIRKSSPAYKAFRMKIGLDPEKDVAHLTAVAAAVVAENKHREIWVDVNQAWKDAPTSLDMLAKIRAALAGAGYSNRFLLEQPTKEMNMEALRDVTHAMRKANQGSPVQILVMADESVWDLDDLKKAVALDAIDMVNFKVQKAGGLVNTMRMAEFLDKQKSKIEVYVGGLLMTDIAATANLHLCLALPRLDYVTSPTPRASGYTGQIATIALKYDHGRTLAKPSAPGLGTGLDLAAAASFHIDKFEDNEASDE